MEEHDEAQHENAGKAQHAHARGRPAADAAPRQQAIETTAMHWYINQASRDDIAKSSTTID